jgi:glycosyltransferase involved in cell wall biosynthesis
MKSLLIHAWIVRKSAGKYYLPYTHWIYLKEIVNYFDSVTLLSPLDLTSDFNTRGLICINSFENVTVIALPFSDSYVNSIKYFMSYLKVYKNLSGYSVFYSRYPVPFGWLQKIFFKKAKRIIHFVGDPIDAAKTNPNFSKFKKISLITFFMPEHLMYMWACRGAKVFTNGYHLTERLTKYGIKAIPLISSTLNHNDFYFDDNKIINPESPKIVYVGYLRKAKGVETVIKAFHLIQKRYTNAKLTIVGSGEFHNHLNQMVIKNKIRNVSFLGHIDDRNQLNDILRSNDIFCFASLSEGSPRVILEAMANGINVISTPVGSLPDIFKNDENILFADFNDEKDFYSKIDSVISNSEKAFLLRSNASKLVREYTLECFIRKIFYES